MNMSYDDVVNLTKIEKRLHTYKVLLDVHLGDKLWKNQQFSALNVSVQNTWCKTRSNFGKYFGKGRIF